MYLGGWSTRNEELRPTRVRKIKRAMEASWVSNGSGLFWGVLKKTLNFCSGSYYLVYHGDECNSHRFLSFQYEGTGDFLALIAILGYLLVMMCGLMGSIRFQTGGISVSREGKVSDSRSNPADIEKVFWAKVVYALLSPLILMLLFIPLAKYVAHFNFPLAVTMFIGLCISIIIAAFQILLDLLNPDFGIKIEFGHSFGKGTGKLMTSMFGSMGVVIFIMLVLMSPPLLGRMVFFGGLSNDTLVIITRLLVVLTAVVMSTLAVVVGKKKLKRLFTVL